MEYSKTEVKTVIEEVEKNAKKMGVKITPKIRMMIKNRVYQKMEVEIITIK